MTVLARTKDTVLVLDEELDRRVRAAAHLVGVNPDAFIVRAIQAGVAKALGEADVVSQPESRESWAIRPTPSSVLRLVADAAGVSTEAIVGPERSFTAARARAVAAYLLRHDAGLATLDTARVLHRKTATVRSLIASVEEVLDTEHPRAKLLDRTRRLFKNGLSSGKLYPPAPQRARSAKLLPGLLACQLVADLTQPELADRAGIARETLARLERLRRRAQAETVEALARALGVPAQKLTTATGELPATLRSPDGMARTHGAPPGT
jgi:DNA-binding XRE family transcriptional regulator